MIGPLLFGIFLALLTLICQVKYLTAISVMLNRIISTDLSFTIRILMMIYFFINEMRF